ncbi:MAG: hypothetical protein L0216_06815 [Planctomycetales bacterium]|nr:hypothetical protein [Planctomycetales bacterium]
MTYPDPKVDAFLSERFAMARFDSSVERDLARRLGAVWTPTLLFCARDGTERHRVVGWVSPDEMLAQAEMALGKIHFAEGRWSEAESRFGAVAARGLPETAPEGQYWLGASRYRQDPKSDGLREAWTKLREQWPASPWAARVSYPRVQG